MCQPLAVVNSVISAVPHENGLIIFVFDQNQAFANIAFTLENNHRTSGLNRFQKGLASMTSITQSQ